MKEVFENFLEYSDYLSIVLTFLPAIILLFGDTHDEINNRRRLNGRGKFMLGMLTILCLTSIATTYNSKKSKEEEEEIRKPINEAHYREWIPSACREIRKLEDQLSKIPIAINTDTAFHAIFIALNDSTPFEYKALTYGQFLMLNRLEREQLDAILSLLTAYRYEAGVILTLKMLRALSITFATQKNLDSPQSKRFFNTQMSLALEDVIKTHSELSQKLKEFRKTLESKRSIDTWSTYKNKYGVD